MNQLDEYLERRKLVWCAAFGATFAKLSVNGCDEMHAAKRSIEIAGKAVALMPGVPGESEIRQPGSYVKEPR